jgi:sugar lactone lactonase YvrE
MRWSIGILFVVAASAIAACAGIDSAQPTAQPDRVWPPPPERARIRYVQQFSTPEDLGIKPSFWGRLVSFAAGAEVRAMIRPMAVAATPDGQLIYVADPDAQCVHRFDLNRRRYACLADKSGSPLISPVGLAIADTGRVYVSDSGRNQVLIADADSDSLQPLALSPPPVQPTGLALNSSGDLFVANTAGHSIGRYDASGKLVREYGSRGSEPGKMNFPTYIWLSSPRELIVTDTMNFRIQRIDTSDGVLGVFGEAGDGTGSLARPKGVAMDRHGHIYVVDGGHHALQIFDREGQLLLAVGKQGQEAGEFWLPSGVFATAGDLIFVADAFNQRVQVFRHEGDEP